MAIQLNEQQQAAVTAPPDAAVIVVASPGSGKTAVLTQRVAYLVGECGMLPSEMVVTTFTRRAADEMKMRLEPLIGSAVSRLQIGTIHGVCLRMLREERRAKDVISNYDRKKIVSQELSYQKLNWDVGWKYPMGWIDRAKMNLITVRQSNEWFTDRLSGLSNDKWQARDIAQKLAQVYKGYEENKGYLNKMDFVDMLLWVAQSLRSDEDFKCRWQSRFKTILVDECQDTSQMAYSILVTLAEPENALFTVGDPDQELFRWAGADPDHNIFGFLDRYTDGVVLPLEINYRSTETIVDVANKVIQANYVGADQAKLAFKKTMISHPEAGVGKAVSVLGYASPEEEASGVRDLLEGMMEDGRAPQDVFIVYRVNSQSRPIEDQLLRSGIPYVVQGSMGFYERKVVKDVLAYLSLVNNEKDDESFQRVCNMATANFFRSTRGFGARWVQECISLAHGHNESLWESMVRMKDRLSRSQQGSVTDLTEMIMGIRERSQKKPLQAISMIRKECYDAYLIRTEGLDAATAHEEQVFEDLEELAYATTQFETIEEFLTHVHEIQEMQAEKSKESVDAVVLSTIHRVKGLERPVVFGVGMSEEILPHRFAIEGGCGDEKLPVENLSGVEDERCAAFVLVSRAQEELYLSHLSAYRNRPVTPSRFLYEMELISKEHENQTAELCAAKVDNHQPSMLPFDASDSF